MKQITTAAAALAVANTSEIPSSVLIRILRSATDHNAEVHVDQSTDKVYVLFPSLQKSGQYLTSVYSHDAENGGEWDLARVMMTRGKIQPVSEEFPVSDMRSSGYRNYPEIEDLKGFLSDMTTPGQRVSTASFDDGNNPLRNKTVVSMHKSLAAASDDAAEINRYISPNKAEDLGLSGCHVYVLRPRAQGIGTRVFFIEDLLNKDGMMGALVYQRNISNLKAVVLAAVFDSGSVEKMGPKMMPSLADLEDRSVRISSVADVENFFQEHRMSRRGIGHAVDTLERILRDAVDNPNYPLDAPKPNKTRDGTLARVAEEIRKAWITQDFDYIGKLVSSMNGILYDES